MRQVHGIRERVLHLWQRPDDGAVDVLGRIISKRKRIMIIDLAIIACSQFIYAAYAQYVKF